ncbi:MAG: hypothetical protein H6739_04620 [Alphaproteobacteria bacterium]|nr:hypothetical protein [Alphaproteobacteria bacterium]
MADNFIFEGFEGVCARIHRRAQDGGYLVLHDRTDSRSEDTLARFDFTVEGARHHLAERHLPQRDPDEDIYGPPRTESPLAEAIGQVTMDDIKEAACAWLRETAEHNTVGEQWRRFRVRLYGPKGISKLDSAQFIVRNEDWEDPSSFASDPSVPGLPKPTFEGAEQGAAVQGVRALGDYYAQYGRLVLSTVAQLQGMNNASLSQVSQQLREARGQVDELVAAILEFRATQAQAERDDARDQHGEEVRGQLVRATIEQLGQAAQALLMARGLPPESLALLQTLSASPELMQTLQRPEVQALMQRPENLQQLAAMLNQAANQFRQAQAAQQAPPPPPPPPGQPAPPPPTPAG